MKIAEYLEQEGKLTYTFHGVSMLPMLRQGRDTVTITKKTGARCKKYDIALYRRGEKYVLHRIVKVLSEGYVILGDNCMRREYDIGDAQILGVLTAYTRGDRAYRADDMRQQLYARIWYALYPIRFVCMWLLRANHPGRKLCRKIKHTFMRVPMNTASFDMTAAFDMLYLCACVLTDTPPSADCLVTEDPAALWRMSKFHALTALVCEGLERTEHAFAASPAWPEIQKKFRDAKEKSVRKNLMLDTERAALFAFLTERGIWHMPMKGILLKDLYPRLGLRQMTDNDILFDAAYSAAVRAWFEERGYKTVSFGEDNHDTYQRAPIYNFEMHTSLFGDLANPVWQAYYRDVFPHLIAADEARPKEYRFRDEDFYIYLLVHGYKHFDSGGVGIRFLFDLRLFLWQKGDTLDFSYIHRELEALSLAAFGENVRCLLDVLFCDLPHLRETADALPRELREMLLWFLSSGAFGTIRQRVGRGIGKHGRSGYLLRRFFPGPRHMAHYHPIFGKYPVLLPIGWIWRAIRQMKIRSGALISELSMILRARGKS